MTLPSQSPDSLLSPLGGHCHDSANDLCPALHALLDGMGCFDSSQDGASGYADWCQSFHGIECVGFQMDGTSGADPCMCRCAVGTVPPRSVTSDVCAGLDHVLNLTCLDFEACKIEPPDTLRDSEANLTLTIELGSGCSIGFSSDMLAGGALGGGFTNSGVAYAKLREVGSWDSWDDPPPGESVGACAGLPEMMAALGQQCHWVPHGVVDSTNNGNALAWNDGSTPRRSSVFWKDKNKTIVSPESSRFARELQGCDTSARTQCISEHTSVLEWTDGSTPWRSSVFSKNKNKTSVLPEGSRFTREPQGVTQLHVLSASM